jgi:hypothetical protein
MRTLFAVLLFTAMPGVGFAQATADAPQSSSAQLIAHWPLAVDTRNLAGSTGGESVRGKLHWIEAPQARVPQAAQFDGYSSAINLPANAIPTLGTSDFAIAAWVNLPPAQTDLPGDIISQYDPAARRGFHLSIKTNAGVTTTQANFRQLQFGIDNDQQSDWQDVGRPGNATLAFALAVHQGQLFAGACDHINAAKGRVYRFQHPDSWLDCGAPDDANAVTALAEFDGQLYAGTGKYRFGGSAMTESTNTNPGGGIYRYAADGKWEPCGKLAGVEAIGGMVVFGGKLYASSLYRPAGFFRYEGGAEWTALATPGVRVEALGVFDGYLYATSYDGGRVFRFDGKSWNDCGQLGGPDENSQTYSFAVYQGRLYVGTWRSGKVYRFEEPGRWTDVGRLGQELEVMGMLVHNGRLTAGTLPLAEVYQYRGGQDWQLLKRLDHTPDVVYRRAWTMAEFDGAVFCSTLPSGRVYRYQAGVSAMHGDSFPAGWHHVVAQRRGDRLHLYLDGSLVAKSPAFDPAQFDLSSSSPLQIGFGENDYFSGQLADVRLYRGALSEQQIRELAR